MGRCGEKRLGSQDHASTTLVHSPSSHGQDRAGTDLRARARARYGQGGLDPGLRGHSPGRKSGWRLGHAKWTAPWMTKRGPPGLGAAPLVKLVSWEHRTPLSGPPISRHRCPRICTRPPQTLLPGSALSEPHDPFQNTPCVSPLQTAIPLHLTLLPEVPTLPGFPSLITYHHAPPQ